MMHPNQDSSGEDRRLFISLQHRKPAPGLAFRPGTRRPRRGPHRKIRFAPSMERLAGSPLPPHVKRRQPLEQARPLSAGERPAGTRTQKRRSRRKSLHAARGGKPMAVSVPPLAKTPPGTHQPRSFQMSRGFRKMLGRLPRAQRARAIAAWQARNPGR